MVLEFRESDKDLISATHVCSRWRSALTSAPPLWTSVVFWDPDRALAYLTRSCVVPIDVSFTITPGSSTNWKFYPKDYYTSRIPWFDRVQSMVIGGENERIEANLRRLCPSTPLLRSLKLNGMPYWTTRPWNTPEVVCPPGKLLGGQVPSLRNLSFNPISPALIDKFPLANLTSLTWIDKRSVAVVRDILPLLGSTPLLELLTLELQVQSVSTVEWMTTVIQRITRAHLVQLRGDIQLDVLLQHPEVALADTTRGPQQRDPTDGPRQYLTSPRRIFSLARRPDGDKVHYQQGTQSYRFQSPTSYISITALPIEDFEVNTPWFYRNAAILLE